MNESKPLIYRVERGIETPERTVKTPADVIRATLAARDATRLALGMDSAIDLRVAGQMPPLPDWWATHQAIESDYNYLTSGADDPFYNDMDIANLGIEARLLRAAQEQAALLTDRGTLTLIVRRLDDLPESAQEQLYRLLGARQGEKKKRGGGPEATPIDEQIRIVEGWFRLKGRMTKEVYAASQGVDQSTLYRWEKGLRKSGLL